MFIVDNKRIATMRERIGRASSLIKSDAYLPMFRNRQKNHKEEFEKSIEIAKTKRNPERYLASVWAVKNIKKSLVWLRGTINRGIAKAAEMRRQARFQKEQSRLKREFNPEGRARLLQLYDKSRFGLRN